MKIKFNSNDNLPLDKKLKLHNMTINIGSVFEENGTFYTQVYTQECLHELQMLEYNRIGTSEGIDIKETNA